MRQGDLKYVFYGDNEYQVLDVTADPTEQAPPIAQGMLQELRDADGGCQKPK